MNPQIPRKGVQGPASSGGIDETASGHGDEPHNVTAGADALPAKGYGHHLLATLTSKKLTLALLGALALGLIPATVSKLPVFITIGRLLLVFLSINLTLCTFRHWRRLPGSVILIHAGVLSILAGSLVSRAGFIATINIYEGGSSPTAFRWDREEDTPLGFDLAVRKINQDFYPTPVRVGVLMNDKPVKLYELKTGESFEHGGFRIDALTLDPLTPALHLAVTGPDGVRSEQTASKDTANGQPGLSFKLVAFQTPAIKRNWVDLEIIPAAAPPVSGQAEVNHPLKWRGLRFYHTATGADPYGQAYAGIQIVNDQGIPLVYFGFVLLCLGNGRFLYQKFKRSPGTKKRGPSCTVTGDDDG